MTQQIDVDEVLTREELEQVKNFAQFLISRRSTRTTQAAEKKPRHKISFEGWIGSLAHVHPEMSDAEFKQFMLDERVREALR